jgi:hypothetical protein
MDVMMVNGHGSELWAINRNSWQDLLSMIIGSFLNPSSSIEEQPG